MIFGVYKIAAVSFHLADKTIESKRGRDRGDEMDVVFDASNGI